MSCHMQMYRTTGIGTECQEEINMIKMRACIPHICSISMIIRLDVLQDQLQATDVNYFFTYTQLQVERDKYKQWYWIAGYCWCMVVVLLLFQHFERFAWLLFLSRGKTAIKFKGKQCNPTPVLLTLKPLRGDQHLNSP